MFQVRRRRRQLGQALGTPKIWDFTPDYFPPSGGSFSCSGNHFGATKSGPANIWIGNAATFDDCTMLVAQTVSSWSNVLITGSLVTDGLTGSNYIYVRNYLGKVNHNGYYVYIEPAP